ncbi:DUF202 domain-containing protein [Dickeya lacustris]|uniref:DUF202 domain-containing protein n=1 Tax=Dickeya lacustris TaxID=2259638 RepID=A0ABY8G2L8_9GAMM|nr:DUF202 domain-containing protein [Dickeya lacustris]WFN54174.1 DUF202 domain-containing protein [Dickeya lacustris]
MIPRPATVIRDPGLQPERTRLAWSRTAFVLLLDSLLLLRVGGQTHALMWLIPGGLLLAMSAMTYLWARLRLSILAQNGHPCSRASRLMMRLLTLVVLLSALSLSAVMYYGPPAALG